jgi:hypothetical protein
MGAASTSGFSDLPEPDPDNKAGFSKSNWDLRLYDVPLPLGQGEFGVVYARTDSGKDISLAFEGGLDWVEDEEAGTSSSLYKLTLAPQVSLGGRFMSRPVIRAFVTYAGWGDDFKGNIDSNDYLNETSGLTYGVQMEAWW